MLELLEVVLLDDVLRADLARAKPSLANPAADRLGVAARALRGLGNGQHCCSIVHLTRDSDERISVPESLELVTGHTGSTRLRRRPFSRARQRTFLRDDTVHV